MKSRRFIQVAANDSFRVADDSGVTDGKRVFQYQLSRAEKLEPTFGASPNSNEDPGSAACHSKHPAHEVVTQRRLALRKDHCKPPKSRGWRNKTNDNAREHG